jgi:maltoporin
MKAHPVALATCLWFGLLMAPVASAQTNSNPSVELLREEMRQMRQDYEQRMQVLERQLQELETNAPASNAVPGVSEHGRAFANIQYQEQGLMRDVVPAETNNPILKARISQVLNDFLDTGGYFRAGYGRDEEGGPQPAFQAPGAFAKYRLGNEAEDYGELMLGKNWYVPDLFSEEPEARPDGTPTGPIARTQIRVSYYNPYFGLRWQQLPGFAGRILGFHWKCFCIAALREVLGWQPFLPATGHLH